jgi:transposase
MVGLRTLLENRWVKRFLKFVHNRGKGILERVDLGFLNGLFQKLKSRRGRPQVYRPKQNFKAVLYGYAHGKYQATEIARLMKDGVARSVCGYLERNPSHDTLSRFLRKLARVVEQVFKRLVKQVKKLGITRGEDQVMDGTDIRTRFRSDPDAKWNWDSTRKEYYWGYGLLLDVCPHTHLPLAVIFTDGKHVTGEQAVEVLKQASQTFQPKWTLGDGEFDTLQVHRHILGLGGVPVIRYNRRNTKNPPLVKFRIQLGHEDPPQGLEEKYRLRPEVEHAISSLKEGFGLEKFTVKGWTGVKTHIFLCLILRLMHAIACHHRNPLANVRKTFTLL